MSDSSIIEQLDLGEYNAPISGARFLAFSIQKDAPLRRWPRAKQDALFTQLTHRHAIPANDSVDQALRALRPGQILTLDSQLDQVSDPSGHGRLTSSLVLGDRDCEVMWVESLVLSNPEASN